MSVSGRPPTAFGGACRRRGLPVTKLAVVALMIAAAVMAAVACGQAAPTEPSAMTIKRASPPIPQPAPVVETEGEGDSGPALVGTPITILLVDNGGAGPFAFDPIDLTFSQGEIVNFTFQAEAAFHTFTVNDLDINVEVNAGETGGLDFVFDTPGVYELVCIPHEVQGMVGTITVN